MMQTKYWSANWSVLFHNFTRGLMIALGFFLPISTAMTSVCIALMIIFFILSGHLFTASRWCLRHPVGLSLWLFYAMFLLGCYHTQAPWSAVSSLLIKQSKFIIAGWWMYLLRDRVVSYVSLFGFLLAMTITLLLSYLHVWGWLTFGHSHIGHGAVFKSHIHMSFLMVCAFYLVVVYQWFAAKPSMWLWGWLGLMGFHLLAINTSRTGYVLLSVAVVVLAWARLSWRGWLVLGSIMLGLLGLSYQYSDTTRQRIDAIYSDYQHYQDGQRYSDVGLRLNFWQVGLKIIADRPVIGSGTASVYQAYRVHVTADDFVTYNPHNEYMYLAIQFGVFGLLMLLGLFAIQWGMSALLPPWSKLLARGLVAIMGIGCLANSLLLDTTESHTYLYLLAWCFAQLPTKGSHCLTDRNN